MLKLSDHYSYQLCFQGIIKNIGCGQGYAAVMGRVGEVEVWGLGGASADEQQAKYQHRENLFSEQRRKVCGPFCCKKSMKPNLEALCKIVC